MSTAAREGLRREFHWLLGKLGAVQPTIQMVVGHGVNMAHAMFCQAYPTSECFQQLTPEERHAYIRAISDAEDRFREDVDPHIAIGYALFKMWVGALAAGDQELMGEFRIALLPFRDKGYRLPLTSV